MPLFGRRSRSVSVSRPTTPSAHSSAQLAASQAFMASRGSQANLSASAAATALRTMSPTPTPVDQVQTRRMLNRKDSTGSVPAAARGRSRGGLQRQNSSSSMTERTFRSPSPGRPSTSSGVPSSSVSQGNAPPVPRLPETYNDIPPLPKKSNRRSASIDEYQLRNNAAQSGAKLATAKSNRPESSAPVNPATLAAKRVTSLQGATELERSDSNNSVNFSYPGRARPSSPPPRPISSPPPSATKQLSSSTPLQNISQTEARRIEHDLQQTAQQAPKKKKKKVDRHMVEGSHLQTGTMNSKPTVTPLAPLPEPQEPSVTTPVPNKKKKAQLTGQATHFPSSPGSVDTDDSLASDTETTPDHARERRTQRASGILTKQPSVVREDWEGEREGEAASPVDSNPSSYVATPSPITQSKKATAANVSRKIEEPNVAPKPQVPAQTTTAESRSLAAPDMSSAIRGPSLSPSRSTRFSNRLSSDITQGRKHDPPPRSVSPGKSALKNHSPSPRVNFHDGHIRRSASLSPSEGTDISVDAPSRKKKSAHVSFNNEPAVVGIAAEPLTPETPQVTSPQYRDGGKKWFGLRNKAAHGTSSSDDEDENAMKPRPALPTFGSVRKSPRNETLDATQHNDSSKMLEAASPASSVSSRSSTTEPTTMDTSISSDHALGSLLSREAQKKKATDTRGPLPPEVTSVEGTGLHSDTESNYSLEERHSAAVSSHGQVTVGPVSTQPPQVSTVTEPTVPVINVQPSTPGTEEVLKHQDSWIVDVPGGFPDQDPPAESTNSKQPQSTGGGEGLGLSKDVTVSPLARIDTTQGYGSGNPYAEGDDASTDNDSIYSDAAEEMSDGDGFGSINAIVHSPISSTPTQHLPSPPESPIVKSGTQLRTIPEHGRQDSWDETHARWKNLAVTARKASLEPAAPITETENKPLSVQKKKSTPAPRQAPPATIPESSRTDPNQSSSYPIVVPKQRPTSQQTSMRKSMRGDGDKPVSSTLRTSVRNGSETAAAKPFRSSMRDVRSSEPIAATSPSRPQSQQESRPAPTGTLQKKSLRAAPQQQRQPSPLVNNDSDSESSFRRRRRARPEAGKYTMKRSMRGGAAREAPSAVADDRRAVRSLSPVSRRPFSSAGGAPTMRTSMRGSVDESAQNKRSSSLFGRNKSAMSPARPASAMVTNSKMKSRFDDSDDEDVPIPRAFQSRYNDSSDDEDGVSNLRPVRGIPRRQDDGDSTDLEDSSEDDGAQRQRKKLTIQTNPPSTAALSDAGTTSSPTTKKKRGLFGMFKKNKAEEVPAMPVLPPNHNNTILARKEEEEKLATPSKDKKSKPTALGFQSKSEQEALVAATQRKLEAKQDRPMSPVRPMSPTGKLQRRVTPQRVMSDSWPLPPKMPAARGDEERPFTSDGLDAAPQSPTGGSEQGLAYSRAGKKKRFPMLRKAFGLKD